MDAARPTTGRRAVTDAVIAWARDPNRKPAVVAFPEGRERDAAIWIDWAQREIAEAIAESPHRENTRRRMAAVAMLIQHGGRWNGTDWVGVGVMPADPDPKMIDAGARHLVNAAPGATWPLSWSAAEVADARRQAEQCWRAMFGAGLEGVAHG